jgi:hypothetical protein
MPIESGPYCQYCADDNGHLYPFEETFERFKQWTRREEPGIEAEALDRKVLDYMAGMPAWKDHPKVTAG